MCVDPATATLIATGVQATMSVAQGVFSYKQGKAEQSALNQQELMSSALEETQMRKESAKFMSRQRLAVLASGADPTSGTADVLARGDAGTLELNALMRRYQGESAAEGLRTQGRQAALAGSVGMGTSFLQAGATALSGFGQWKTMKGSGSPQTTQKSGGFFGNVMQRAGG